MRQHKGKSDRIRFYGVYFCMGPLDRLLATHRKILAIYDGSVRKNGKLVIGDEERIFYVGMIDGGMTDSQVCHFLDNLRPIR